MQPPLPFSLQSRLQNDLRGSERLIWSGSPRPGRMAKRALPIVIVAVPFTAFAIFWMIGANNFKIPDFRHFTSYFSLFGLPFLLVGLGMLSAPLWAFQKAASTAYAITSERAFILEPRFFGGINVTSFLPRQLNDIRRVQFENGDGDLILERRISSNGEGGRTTTDLGFFGIADVKDVEAMLLALGNSAGLSR